MVENALTIKAFGFYYIDFLLGNHVVYLLLNFNIDKI